MQTNAIARVCVIVFCHMSDGSWKWKTDASGSPMCLVCSVPKWKTDGSGRPMEVED